MVLEDIINAAQNLFFLTLRGLMIVFCRSPFRGRMYNLILKAIRWFKIFITIKNNQLRVKEQKYRM